MEAKRTSPSEKLRPMYDIISIRVSDQINRQIGLMGHKEAIRDIDISINELWKAVDALSAGDINKADIDITRAIAWLQSIRFEIMEKILASASSNWK